MSILVNKDTKASAAAIEELIEAGKGLDGALA